ncbi:hypothetical protein ACH4UV_33395 [Streptomyces sp. NPDC020802]|uniref:hypothetical protein n=1 Tax=Streptomyces sp. NPDC020802 TaxID=3365094 RepID=UPI0037886C86
MTTEPTGRPRGPCAALPAGRARPYRPRRPPAGCGCARRPGVQAEAAAAGRDAPGCAGREAAGVLRTLRWRAAGWLAAAVPGGTGALRPRWCAAAVAALSPLPHR